MTNKLEMCFMMLKPGFANKNFEDKLLKEVKSENLTSLKITNNRKKYTLEKAQIHYKNIKNEDYFPEVVDYLTSDYSYGYCIFGENAINKCKEIRTRLRIYSLDNMRNVVHSSSNEELAKTELSNFISI